MNYQRTLYVAMLAPVLLLAQGQAGWAAVGADEAGKLKTVLTPMGAEKAANQDGTIPAWDGGYTTVAPGYKNGQPRPDPYASEKPLYTVTAKNMDRYAAHLSDGVVAMLKKYPDFRLDVYPTHRSAAAPKWVYENTFKNATRAKLGGNGVSLEGAYGGIPFPIPKSGAEAMWNHKLAWQGEASYIPFQTFVVNADGSRVLATRADEWNQYPYYFKDGSLETFKGDYWLVKQNPTAPSYKAGESGVGRYHVSESAEDPIHAWQYLVGQRRVRRSPSIGYDTPDFVTSGIANFDDALVFSGVLDRYNWKIVGKKELIVPYNNNRAMSAKLDSLTSGKFLNPDMVRWELHRVWEIEATVAQGKRHAAPKRRFYLDEDTWTAVLADSWDAQGQLWKMAYSLMLLAPDLPGVVGTMSFGVYNLQAGAYVYNVAPNELSAQFKVMAPMPDKNFTADALVGDAIR